jgi:2'-5' RNA ligase
MRLFVALDINDEIRERIARFLEGVRGFAPDVRWVRPESLHITLKFIGEKSEEEAGTIVRTMEAIHANAFGINSRGYGFFPTARAPRVFWVGIEPEPKLTSLAAAVDSSLCAIGIAKEEHAFNAHLTLARTGGGSGSPSRQKSDAPNRRFQRLQEKLASLSPPEFGTVTAREFFLYKSQLGPGSSTYTKLTRFGLQ